LGLSWTKEFCELAGPHIGPLGICEDVGGTPKASFCNANATRGICPYLKSQKMRPCGSDDDCKHPCCSQQKKWVTDMCDDVDTAMLDALITRLKTGDQILMMCDDSDCYDSYGNSSSSSGSAPAPNLGPGPNAVVCGSGDTDSECVHCSSDSSKCNSKDCKFEEGACVAGNGLMTAIVDKDSKFFVTITVTLKYTKDQFDQTKRDKYKAAVANAAGTVAANVEIVKITEARRRAGKVDVETKVRRTNQRARRRAAVECGISRRIVPALICFHVWKRSNTCAANDSHTLQTTRRSSRLIKRALIRWNLLSRTATTTTQRNARSTKPSSVRGLRRARPPASPSRCEYSCATLAKSNRD